MAAHQLHFPRPRKMSNLVFVQVSHAAKGNAISGKQEETKAFEERKASQGKDTVVQVFPLYPALWLSRGSSLKELHPVKNTGRKKI